MKSFKQFLIENFKSLKENKDSADIDDFEFDEDDDSSVDLDAPDENSWKDNPDFNNAKEQIRRMADKHLERIWDLQDHPNATEEHKKALQDIDRDIMDRMEYIDLLDSEDSIGDLHGEMEDIRDKLDDLRFTINPKDSEEDSEKE